MKVWESWLEVHAQGMSRIYLLQRGADEQQIRFGISLAELQSRVSKARDVDPSPHSVSVCPQEYF